MTILLKILFIYTLYLKILQYHCIQAFIFFKHFFQSLGLHKIYTLFTQDKEANIFSFKVDSHKKETNLVDEADLVLHIRQTFLHCTDILYILCHHIQLSIIVEFIHTLPKFLQFSDDLFSLLQELSFSCLLRFLYELQSWEDLQSQWDMWQNENYYTSFFIKSYSP